VIADGSIAASGSVSLHPEPDALLEIELADPARRDLFDLLLLTNFSRMVSGETSDFETLLGALAIGGGEVKIYGFDDIVPAMVKSMKVAD
jgi:hypothetical protein